MGADAPIARASKKSKLKPAPKQAKVYDLQAIGDAWNTMAAAAGLAQVVTLTEGRKKALMKRIDEHTHDTVLKAIASIPHSRFLTGKTADGWKASFDWLIQPSSFVKLIEGTYHNDGKGKGSGWTE